MIFSLRESYFSCLSVLLSSDFTTDRRSSKYESLILVLISTNSSCSSATSHLSLPQSATISFINLTI